jgi:carboxypeptidase Q
MATAPYEKRVNAWDLSRPVITPQINVAAEQYNRIVRLVTRQIPVQLEVNIAARFYDNDPMSYNVIAEIPGTDLKDEVVIIPKHTPDSRASRGFATQAIELMQSCRRVG